MTGLALTMLLDRAAQLYGERPATRFGERTTTWRALADESARLAGGLARIGVGRGDRVAVLALNSDRYFSLFFAVWRLGALAVPLNTRWSTTENALALEDSEPKALFVDDAFRAEAERLARPGLTIVALDDGGGDLPAYADLLDGEPAADAGAGGEDGAGLFYTGGTTGRPKAAVLTHAGLSISLLASGLMQPAADTPPRILTVLPLFHLSGAQQVIGAALRGTATRILPQFDVAEVLRLIEAERITHLSLVPSMWGMLFNHPDYARRDLSSLQAAMYGASPMPEATVRDGLRKLPGAGFAQGYGQTETSGIFTLLGPGEHDPDGPHPERLRSAGRPLPFAHVVIAGEDGAELPRGQVGEIRVRGPHLMREYWRRTEETAATLVDGWVRTGDAGYMDDGGYVFIVDRVKDMIISGGENVFSAEVENALSLHPAVLECAVIGAPDARWGERVVAVVRLRPDASADAEALTAHCRERIAGYKCPREVVFRDAPFPLSAAGKVLKRELRRPYWDGQTRAVG